MALAGSEACRFARRRHRSTYPAPVNNTSIRVCPHRSRALVDEQTAAMATLFATETAVTRSTGWCWREDVRRGLAAVHLEGKAGRDSVEVGVLVEQ